MSGPTRDGRYPNEVAIHPLFLSSFRRVPGATRSRDDGAGGLVGGEAPIRPVEEVSTPRAVGLLVWGLRTAVAIANRVFFRTSLPAGGRTGSVSVDIIGSSLQRTSSAAAVAVPPSSVGNVGRALLTAENVASINVSTPRRPRNVIVLDCRVETRVQESD
jgi:hypothetical protein